MFRQNKCYLENLVISLYPHKWYMGTLEASGAKPRWSRAKSFLSAPLGTKIHLCTKFQVSTFYGFRWAVLSQSVRTSPYIYIDYINITRSSKSFLILFLAISNGWISFWEKYLVQDEKNKKINFYVKKPGKKP